MKFYEKVLIGSVGTASAGVVAWKTMFPWIGHDLKLLKAGGKVMKQRESAMSSLLIDKFEKLVVDTPKKPFIIYEDNIYTYEFVDQMACKIANIAKSWGLKPRDCVAIMIQNEPSFIWTFLGLQKLGITVAKINFNLRMHPLIHSILAADPKYLIVGPGDGMLEAVIDVVDSLGELQVYVQGLDTLPAPHGLHSLDPLLAKTLPLPISPLVRQSITLEDICCYIYTSGTTGNPKPAIINHGKSIGIGCCLLFVDLSADDNLYVVLPLYHSSGGGIALYGAILTGATIILRRKFSASNFWSDVCRYNVTVFQYIGELFRYLLSQPPSDFESSHKIRAVFGNGLRKDIWLDVQKRFKLPLIAEFFGATEGVTMLINMSNVTGAIGRLSPFLNKLDPAPKELVKFDFTTAMPIRDKNGRCIKVGIGEPGLFIAKVPEEIMKEGSLNVYRSSNEANEKKLVRDAFTKGDLWFNYGDVFTLDKNYFLYFHDRIGDTFRWKGENVSTTELANMITSVSFVNDANVYGVTIPGHDGRAGMVAITLKEGLKLGEGELKELYDHVCQELPTYARPLFLRVLDAAVLTNTFKQRKVELVSEGFDLNQVKDPLYYLDNEKHTYSPLTTADLSKFLSSKL
ncbi:long-chain fatty acid transport protein 2-like [Physella acuta]|uniref:long-chain fatty acid transport protein 2-like n=1 Tax=Physella acuta TaxID=109671 RepID=UPI0027DD74B8|nr:long-chain fatty acid transport protein 2-like [Physella acuta]XP_059148321.1 long-chain fatty acid transport protein 2-like [Physella acuta]XP_059148322.1 long-chain fatty acid transport protein 2-like [Physella acuta]XP_059148323.1 long-chain fatty acid transport protein 2-like [Physella acuta]